MEMSCGGWTDPGGLTRSRRGRYPKDAYGWVVYGEEEKERDMEEEYGGGRGGESVAVCSPSVSELRNAPERGSFKPWALLISMSGLSRAYIVKVHTVKKSRFRSFLSK